jgi:hypothetical protein
LRADHSAVPNLAEEQFEHAHPRDRSGLAFAVIAIVYWLVLAAVVAVVLFAVAWYAGRSRT